MAEPIINPSTLTEEQRKKIRALHKDVVRTYMKRNHISFEGWFYILDTIFGESIYKGEKI